MIHRGATAHAGRGPDPQGVCPRFPPVTIRAMPERYYPEPGLGLVLIGGGGHAAVVLDAARCAGWRVDGFYDDNPEAHLASQAPHLGTIRDLTADLPAHQRLILAVGDIRARLSLLAQNVPHELAERFITVAHPSAIIAPSAEIGAGTFVAAGAIINPRARVSLDCTINTGAIVEHDCWVRANAHIAPGAILAGGVSIGRHSLIGMGARVLPGHAVGMWSVIGAGSVVTHDVPDRTTVAGVPAAPLAGAGERPEDVDHAYAFRAATIDEEPPATRAEID